MNGQEEVRLIGAFCTGCRLHFRSEHRRAMDGMETNPPKRQHTLLMIVAALAIVALVIDLVDGYAPKILTSGGLVIGLAGMLGERITGRGALRYVAITGLLVCIGSAVYRAGVHQGWIG